MFLPLSDEAKAALYTRSVQATKWPAFLSAHGITLGEAEGGNWAALSGAAHGKINLLTGDWHIDGLEKSALDLIAKLKGWSEYDLDASLHYLAQNACVEIPESKAGIPEALLEQTRKDLTYDHMAALKARLGVSEAVIQKYGIGLYERGYVLPVVDPDGIVRYARTFNEATDGAKWLRRLDAHGMEDGQESLLGARDITPATERVILCDSELDMLAVASAMPEDASTVVCSLIDGFPHHAPLHLENKQVVIVVGPTADEQKQAAEWTIPLLSEMMGKRALRGASIVRLEQEPDRLWRWLRADTWTAFQARINEAVDVAALTGPKELHSLLQIDDRGNTDRHVIVPVTVTGDYSAAYDVPVRFRVRYCAKQSTTKKCSRCGTAEFDLTKFGEVQMACCGEKSANVESLLGRHCCTKRSRPALEVTQKISLRKIIVAPYKPENDMGQSCDRTAYMVVPPGPVTLTEPRGYKATAWTKTDPHTQRRTLLIEKLTPIVEPWERYDLAVWRNHLEAARSLGYQGIMRDLVEHKTRIYGADHIMLAILLTFCSPRWLIYNSKQIRGWVLTLLMGDTSVGKSETWKYIAPMLGYGGEFHGHTGKRTGLLFACVKDMTGNFKCQPGVLPRNSRKLVCIEEISGMNFEDLNQMTEAMDSGEMKVDFSANAKYETQTRVIMNSNPKLRTTLGDYQYGCMAIKAVLPSQAMIRRLDQALVLRKLSDVNDYHKLYKQDEPPKVTPEMLQAVVFRAWSLTPEQVQIETPTIEAAMAAAISMATYSEVEDVPLAAPAILAQKIARLASALAVLDCSGPDDFSRVDVLPRHVELVKKHLLTMWNHPDCGFDKYAATCVRASSLDDWMAIAAYFTDSLGNQNALRGGSAFAQFMMTLASGAEVGALYRQELDCSEHEYEKVLTFLIAHHLVKRDDGKLKATGKLHRVLERVKAEMPVEWAILNGTRKA